MAKKGAAKILHRLKEDFSLPQWTSSRRNSFQTLIRTVLSQATANRNTARAYGNLSKRFPITPEALAKADGKEIQKAIRVAGLYRNKSKVIKALSHTILERFDGSLDFIHSLPLEEARRLLMSLPGIGPKTADVVLLFSAQKPTFPIDTHIDRVSKRLGLAPLDADYEGVRRALQSLYPPKDYLVAHLLLISIGRKYCRARIPQCRPCPLNALCPSKNIEEPERHAGAA